MLFRSGLLPSRPRGPSCLVSTILPICGHGSPRERPSDPGSWGPPYSGAPVPLSPEPAPVCTAPAASPRHADLVTLCVRPWLGPTRQGALPWSAGPGLGPLSAFLLGLPVVSRLSPQGAVLCVRGPPPQLTGRCWDPHALGVAGAQPWRAVLMRARAWPLFGPGPSPAVPPVFSGLVYKPRVSSSRPFIQL